MEVVRNGPVRVAALVPMAAGPPLPPAPPADGRGLTVIQVDGCSYRALQKALADGLMPHVKALLDAQSFTARPFMAGVPCTTPASLSGFAYGYNDKIPGFDWYDKKAHCYYSADSYKDFHQGFEQQGQQHGGPGLYTKGSVQSSIVGGGAPDTHMVLDAMSNHYQAGGTKGVLGYLAPEVGELMKHPVQWLKTAAMFMIEVVRGIYDDATDESGICLPATKVVKLSAETASENVLLTDVATLRMKDEMRRGVPVMFADFAGYDKASHHHGPFSKQAMRHLQHIDAKIGELYKEAHKAGHRDYELVLLSDHGQSPGLEFAKMYGVPFQTWVNALVPPGERILGAPSGSLNHLYFTSTDQQLGYDDLQKQYPGLIDKLIAHPGIELVSTRQGSDTVIIGKNGSARVHNGQIQYFGQDVLARRGDPRVLASQIAHVTQMPNAGDLVVFGTWDGQRVCTFVEGEDALGGHGGLGGFQDTAMLITEAGRKVDTSQIANSQQMYPILRSFLPADAQL